VGLLNVIAFLGLVAGSFILLSLDPFEFAETIIKPFKNRKTTLKSKVNEVIKNKKSKGLKLLIKETKEILEATNKGSSFSSLCIWSFALFVLGVMIAISLNNLFLVPVLVGGFSLLPFWYVKFTAIFYKKQLNAELETALSVITTSYMRSESIITAVDENKTYINPPVADVFKSFLMQTKLINSNIKMALENLKSKIDNDVFREWVDAVISCQEDKNLKTTLTPIVSKLSDMRIVSAELDYLLYEPMKEFITMTILLVGNIPLMYFLNKSWYQTLMFTAIGKAILAICALVIFASLSAVIKITKPVEYRQIKKG
jgi:Flp pilus assembly protein TadB